MNQLLRNKSFLIVTSSDLLQNLAIWIRNMAILYFIVEQTGGDPLAVSLITVLEYVPIFVFSFIGGGLADRWNPKKTMIWGDVLSTLSIVMILIVFWAGYWQVLYAATFVSATVSQFSQPSSAKIFKRNVPEEHVQTAIALTQSLHSLFIIVGPLLGTFIYTTLGLQASLYTLLFLFISSAIVLTFLPSTTAEREKQSSLYEDLLEGWRFILRTPSLKWLAVVFAIVGLAEGLVSPLQIFIITERLHLDETYVSYLSGIAGLGLLLGSGIAAVVSQKMNQTFLLVAGICMMALTTIVEALSTSFALTLTIRFFGSISLAFINIVISTFMVAQVEEKMIGRVNGTIMPLFMGAILIGSSVTGLLMNATSLLTVYMISAAVIFVSVLPGLLIRFNDPDVKDTKLDHHSSPF
ncbi:MFS transporter [Paenibacillus sp. Marseille-Q4541]|uniref:MFS transporter n=1 Tax=Paenibacillus sp. Marseille-Q4541 TaxID=2831522 RepID=UPI001BAAA719|nr:MFS transporter [Paenibacillus sp. Marseille-Q4541]